jgi:hypothetical protein
MRDRLPTRVRVPLCAIASALAVWGAGLAAGPHTAGAQEKSPEKADKAKEPTDAQKERLAAMKRMASKYELAAGKDGETKLRLTAEPVLRWSNPERGTVDGCVYFFTDNGRPQAALTIYPTRDGKAWNHEFQSLAERELVAKKGEAVAWAPDKPGVEFKPVPDAPAPAETAAGRLVQMRALADRFAARVTFPKNKSELRRLAAPVHRYGDPKRDPIDGAAFVFALATDPELLLLLEARAGREAPQWRYALARQTRGVIEVEYDSRAVWSVEKWEPSTSKPQQPYFEIPRQSDD